MVPLFNLLLHTQTAKAAMGVPPAALILLPLKRDADQDRVIAAMEDLFGRK